MNFLITDVDIFYANKKVLFIGCYSGNLKKISFVASLGIYCFQIFTPYFNVHPYVEFHIDIFLQY